MEENKAKIISMTMEEVFHDAMIPYSEHVIMDRAIPRVEDGLKPVQRRVLYSMHELGLTPDKPFKKCARIVGDCLGKYHPHGDTSVYQALVRMAQPFNMGSVLVDGHGNFGSVDGDGAAAMRYTEARLAPLAMELMRDLEKDTVRWVPNFDDTTTEPDYLPGRFPNLLVNGATGIAIGLATNIPTHNLAEAIDAVIAYIDNPRIKLKDLMKIMPGPDFPTGGVIIKNELEKAYETGKGKIIVRSRIHLENEDSKPIIVIDEIPYAVNKSSLLESIIKVREDHKEELGCIAEVLDESDRSGTRAVIKLRRDSALDGKEVNADQRKKRIKEYAKNVIDLLCKYTQMQITYGINMVAIAGGKPQLMSLLDIIAYYVDYQQSVIIKRTRYELDQAKERAHILEGLVLAVRNIDEVVAIIKKSGNTTEAKVNLRRRFEISEKQAQAIVDLRLGRLTSLEIYKLEKELAQIRALIEKLTAILGSKRLQMSTIKEELSDIKRRYKYPRKTDIVDSLEELDKNITREEKASSEGIIALTSNARIKRMSARHFAQTSREFSEKTTRSEICRAIVKVNENDRLLCFSDLGNCYKLSPSAIAECKWRDKGTDVKSVIKLEADEHIVYIRAVGDKMPECDVLFFTRYGMVKRTPWIEYDVSKNSYQAIKLSDGDRVISIEDYEENKAMMMISQGGMCINASKEGVPIQHRMSAGVKGMNLADGDSCIYAGQIMQDYRIVLVTDRSYAKLVSCEDVGLIGRGGKGVKIIDFKSSNGRKLVFAKAICHDFPIVLEMDGDYLMSVDSDNFSMESRTHGGRAIIKGNPDITYIGEYVSDITRGDNKK